MATVRQKHRADQNEEIVETGDIFFFYRPRVEQTARRMFAVQNCRRW